MALPPKRTLTQDRLRTAVQELLLVTDWSAITVQHVAERAGVSIGTFYNYYDSKDDALADVRQCLTEVIKKDINLLLATRMTTQDRISLLLKYFVNIANAKPAWANYFYRAEAFHERIDGGLCALLEPLIIEGATFAWPHHYDEQMVASFIENGLFPLLKLRHQNQIRIEDQEAAQMVQMALAAVGLTGQDLELAAKMPCPVTPLAELPFSIYQLQRANLGYV
ncbi:TetR/AcrR family transcriptional regulator [Marinomonas ostreistagni]|uniref:TetR/AcrR family transcriptional regulator n=1 Tax=Marinomonas ostreistagni TaxID=359209 RepID=UPI001951E8C4|nr:TetR/AcrR family transcriptional regulator [Marinomonas ostreistagni]MBM6550021.1 TetR/AcrR family transcriptional regulator [Marinomonas ostreistagni]